MSKSNFDILKEQGTLPQSATLDEAVEILAHEAECIDCVAYNECSHSYGTPDHDNQDHADCLETVRAFLTEDHIDKREE